MRTRPALAIALLAAAFTAARAADPDPADLVGKWELTGAAAGLPKGTVFDFQKAGKLFVVVEANGDTKVIEFGYKLNKNVLNFDLPNGKSDTTDVVTLTKTDLVCKDKNGTTAKFKRVKGKTKD